MLNSVAIIGRTTEKPEVKEYGEGKKVYSFTLAVNEGQDKTSFIDVKFFGENKALSELVDKGHKIGVSGSLRQEKWVAKDGTNKSKVIIVAYNVELCSDKQ